MDAPVRVLALLRAGLGVALLRWPQRITSAAGNSPATFLTCLFTRVLGARQLVQATLELIAPGLLTPRRGALIDAAHSVTMFALAAFSRQHRRVALANAALAATLSAFGMLCSRHAGATLRRPRALHHGLGLGRRSSVDELRAPIPARRCCWLPSRSGWRRCRSHGSRLAFPGGDGGPQPR